jgi:hypothetical protein
MHVGATVVAYRARTPPALAIVPYIDGELIDGSSERLDEFAGLAGWWPTAERVWDGKKGEATRLTLHRQVDFQNKLSKQFPLASNRVVYTKSGQHLAACRVSDPEAIIDHTLYWTAVDSVDEGRYLCAVLNSQTLSVAVMALQSRGQRNPRHFDMHVFALPFPAFDASNDVHVRLAALTQRAELVPGQLDLDDSWQFQRESVALRARHCTKTVSLSK